MVAMTAILGHNLRSMQFTAVIWHDPTGWYCSLNPETGVASQGSTVEEALANLEEATTLFLEECSDFEMPAEKPAFVTSFTVPDLD